MIYMYIIYHNIDAKYRPNEGANREATMANFSKYTLIVIYNVLSQ